VLRLGRFVLEARHRVLKGLATLRFGNAIFPRDELSARLLSASHVTLPKILEGVVRVNIDEHGIEPVEAAVADTLARLPAGKRVARRIRVLFISTVRAIAFTSLERALHFGDRFIGLVDDKPSLRTLASLHMRAGGIARPIALLDRHHEIGGRRVSAEAKLRTDAELLAGGVRWASGERRDWQPASDRRVAYYLAQSLPHHSSGYAIRSHWLLKGLRDKDWDVHGIARFGYPNDRYDFLGASMVASEADVDGLVYRFAPDRRGFRGLNEQDYHDRAVATLVRQCAELRPALIHSASNYQVGLAGTAAARGLGIPSIYEVRGLWHMTRASKQPEYEDSDHYRLTQQFEVQAAKNADHVFAITGAIRDILVADGVPAGKITVLPNAVNVEQFVPREPDQALADELGIHDKTVIGFVGSFADYEGLDYLLEAARELRDELGPVFHLLLVGDGAAYRDLRVLAKKLGIEDLLHMTGRVPHDQVPRFYSLIDVAVFPRKGVRVCEVVSPLKPFEAMAMGKAVIASDVKALAEIVDHERTGLLHCKDDASSLRDQLRRLIEAPELRATLATSGRAWVLEHRSWAKITDIIDSTYRRLLGR